MGSRREEKREDERRNLIEVNLSRLCAEKVYKVTLSTPRKLYASKPKLVLLVHTDEFNKISADTLAY